jgi:hypothetical protein
MTLDKEPTELLQQRYVQELLRLYVATPGVVGRVRRADRQLARDLYDHHVPLHAVATAFIVAAARRIRHNAYSTRMPPIRSLHYFKGPIQEMLERPLGHREIEQLRESLRDHCPTIRKPGQHPID